MYNDAKDHINQISQKSFIELITLCKSILSHVSRACYVSPFKGWSNLNASFYHGNTVVHERHIVSACSGNFILLILCDYDIQ